MNSAGGLILVVEDGDEYLDNLSRLLPDWRLVQAHDAADALSILARERPALVCLDMRFDRLERGRLVGDVGEVQGAHGLDEERAWRHLAQHQGLYILAALRQAGHGELPVVLFYDFSAEPRRFANLRRTYPGLRWLPDAATAAELRLLVDELTGATGGGHLPREPR